MQLRRLEVRAIRSYEQGHVDFAPGTTLIIGDVGAGKTSLLYAIEMALFGVAEVDAAYLVRHGAGHAEVSVRFDDAEHRYEVARRFRRVRRKGRETFEAEEINFREDGQKTSYSATEIRQRVIALLGFPDNPNPQAHSDLWRWAIYVPQEQMREILAAKPQDRLETIRKALGVERYRIAADNAQLLGADLRASARNRRESADRLAHYDREFAEAIDAADRLRLDRAAQDAALGPLTGALDVARVQRDAAETAARGIDADLRELDSLEREQATDRREIEQRRRRAAERVEEAARRAAEALDRRAAAQELPAAEQALADADRRLVDLRAYADRLATRASELLAVRTELLGAERQGAEIGRRRERARLDADAASAELERAMGEGPAREPPPPTPVPLVRLEELIGEARTEERAALERLAHARRSLDELTELLAQGNCPRCHQPVRSSDFATHRADAESAAAEADRSHRAASEAVAAREAERKARERYERAHERWAEVEKRRATLREVARRRAEEVGEIDGLARASDAQIAGLRSRIAELGPIDREADEHRRRVVALEQERDRARERVERARRAAEQALAADEAARSLSAEAERAARELAAAEARVADRGRRQTVLLPRRAERASIEERRGATAREVARAERAVAEARESIVRIDTRLDAEVRRSTAAERGRSERAELVADAVRFERTAEWCTGPFRRSVLTMEQERLAHAQASFDRAFGRFFSALVDDPALLARTDASFTPEVLIEGEATPAEALSGGERTALALAFRLALAEVVRSLGEVRLATLLLDEPTDGFSAEQVVRMGELLRELALPQVILVSHEAQLAAVADRTIRVRKIDGKAVLETDAPAAEGPATPEDPAPARRRVRPATLESPVP